MLGKAISDGRLESGQIGSAPPFKLLLQPFAKRLSRQYKIQAPVDDAINIGRVSMMRLPKKLTFKLQFPEKPRHISDK